MNDGVIEVRLEKLAQLFNSLDPSPFHERDLDDDAEAHIVGWARELSEREPLAIVLDLPREEAVKARSRDVAASLANYFETRADMADRDLRELFREGRRAIGIGLPILAACLVASQQIGRAPDLGPAGRVVAESLVILGWVANWKPLEIFLYDWWPIRRRRDLYRRLAAARVEVRERGL